MLCLLDGVWENHKVSEDPPSKQAQREWMPAGLLIIRSLELPDQVLERRVGSLEFLSSRPSVALTGAWNRKTWRGFKVEEGTYSGGVRNWDPRSIWKLVNRKWRGRAGGFPFPSRQYVKPGDSAIALGTSGKDFLGKEGDSLNTMSLKVCHPKD